MLDPSQTQEKDYSCPNCGSDKEEFRDECPDCGYQDKKIS